MPTYLNGFKSGVFFFFCTHKSKRNQRADKKKKLCVRIMYVSEYYILYLFEHQKSQTVIIFNGKEKKIFMFYRDIII